jgi:hypothetical protein
LYNTAGTRKIYCYEGAGYDSGGLFPEEGDLRKFLVCDRSVAAAVWGYIIAQQG